MKYFIDTEFLEGTQREKFPVSLFRKETKPTIDLISIGILGEDGREFYAISKDFNLKEAWNRYYLADDYDVSGDLVKNIKKEYWIRENVLTSIYNELANFHINYTARGEHAHFKHAIINGKKLSFTYKNLKWLINNYGKTNKQIAEDILEFVYPLEQWHALHENSIIDKSFPKTLTLGVGTFATVKELLEYSLPQIETPQFYGYFADYDWVAFCWLFGKMMDLPNGFPMYCVDLKQKLDDYFEANSKDNKIPYATNNGWVWVNSIKEFPDFPRQTNEHNALEDARWNKKLYEFLKLL
jgi:hypothetical protein